MHPSNIYRSSFLFSSFAFSKTGIRHSICALIAACAFAAPDARAQLGDDSIIRFSNAQKFVYGVPGTIAPLKVSDTEIDWLRQGERGADWSKAYWAPSGEIAGGQEVMAAAKSAPLRGAMGDIDGDGRMDLVTVKDGKFWCLTDAADSGRRRFPETSGRYLRFVYGDDLMIPDYFPESPYEMNNSVHVAIGDLDGDGLMDLIVTTTFVGVNPWEPRGGLTRYIPSKFTGGGRGWIGDQWAFSDIRATVWWYKNVGKKGSPLFADAHVVDAGEPARALMFTGYLHARATPIDWNGDGRADLVVSADNRVMVFLNTGGRTARGEPQFDNGHELKFAGNPRISLMKNATPYRDRAGALRMRFSSWSLLLEARQIDPARPYEFGTAAPVLFKDPPLFLDSFPVPTAADWDGDGKLDLLAGYQDGAVRFFRNLDKKGGPSRWAPPVELEADGKPLLLHLQNPRSKQGPVERLWGYTAPIAIDFDGDGDLDIVSGNSGENFWYFENIGTRAEPKLTSRGPLLMTTGKPIETAWRTRPAIADFNGDGVPDIIGQSPDGHLVAWWGKKIGNGEGAGVALRFSEPETLLDAKGFPFLIATTSHGGGRSIFAVARWNKKKLPDLLMSPFFSARTEFIPFFKNMGMQNGRLLFELRWRQIAREGHVSKTRFSHYRMLEPASFGAPGSTGAIAGVDDGDMYYWETPTVEPIKDKPLSYYLETAGAVYNPKAPRAALIVPSPFGTIEKLKEGAPVFNNRPYKFGALPEIMRGRDYVLGPEEARYVVCEAPGIVYALVPGADGPRREIMIASMLERGFEVVKHPSYKICDDPAYGEAVIMQKQLEKGARIILSSWAVFFH